MVRNKYKVLQRIGGGGQSCVYLAESLNHSIKVVVKVLMFQSYSQKAREEELILFSREAQIFEKIRHPLLPELFDFFEEDGRHYIVEEYIEGKSLEKIIHSSLDPMGSEYVLRFLKETLELLEMLHNQEPAIIVRDIKPGNIIIDSKGNPHIIDFTIAREHIPGKGDTVRMGSPGYAPPEQYKGSTDQRSDIYSLGATAYQMITRFDPSRKPFALPGILEINKKADKDLAVLIEKATSMDPEERYQSASEMKIEVEQILKTYDGDGNKARKPLLEFRRLFPVVLSLALIFGILFFLLQKWESYSQEKQAAIRNAGLCYRNLARISLALENYARDHNGEYPESLNRLVPDYIRKIPVCPEAGVDTYSATYKQSVVKETKPGGEDSDPPVTAGSKGYILFCRGHNHKNAGMEPDRPRYEKGVGLE